MDREKVLTWLEICGKNNDCSGCCPYSENGFGEYGRCRESLMADAYDLLKEQEAKCLSKDELYQLKEHEFVWYENFEGFLYCMEIIGICYSSGRVTDIQFTTPTAYVEKSAEDYGERYRIWTKQPTKEQMSNLKWD